MKDFSTIGIGNNSFINAAAWPIRHIRGSRWIVHRKLLDMDDSTYSPTLSLGFKSDPIFGATSNTDAERRRLRSKSFPQTGNRVDQVEIRNVVFIPFSSFKRKL